VKSDHQFSHSSQWDLAMGLLRHRSLHSPFDCLVVCFKYSNFLYDVGKRNAVKCLFSCTTKELRCARNKKWDIGCLNCK